MDKMKLIAACILFVLAIIVPLLIFVGGGGITIVQMAANQADTNVLSNILVIVGIAGVAFLIFVGSALFLLFRMKNMPWLAAGLPFLFGTAYTASIADLVPDIVPVITKMDDGAAVTFGAIFSFLLALKRDERTPKWVLIPLLIAAVYTFFGGVIPGGLDEFIVQGLSFLVYAYGITRPHPSEPTL